MPDRLSAQGRANARRAVQSAPISSPAPRYGVLGIESTPVVSESQQRGVQRVTVDLPLPPNILRPNQIAGAPTAAVTKARRRTRTDACKVAASAWRGAYRCDMPGWTHVRATATFFGVSRLTDSDNAYAWLKNVRDGIADALMAGGSDHGWEWEGEPKYEKGGRGVVVEIWPVKGEM